jgi:cytochrome b
MLQRIMVWDLPTRAFHWLQALAFGGAYLTSDSERYRDIHVALGYIMLGLIVFRLLWGFIGTRYARFSSFLFKPGDIVVYLLSLARRNPSHYPGHNPAGSVAVWLLLSLGLFLCGTGVMALQDDAGDLVIEMHSYATDAMLLVIALHLVGVALSTLLHRENLVRAMITGYKPYVSGEGIQRTYRGLAALMLVAVVAFGLVFLRS